jgi:hypothetical protein
MSNNNSISRDSRINDTNNNNSNRNRTNSEISEIDTEKDISKINPTKLGTSEIDVSEKTVDLIDSPKVHTMKEAGKDYIDIDIEHIEEGKFYRVIYHSDTYCIEKLKDGQIAFYEVIQ